MCHQVLEKKFYFSVKGLGLELLPDDVPFDEASPSLTHMAVKALVDNGICQFVVSQNVDGLHLRSGLDSEKLSELHGNIFQERCDGCEKVFFRNFDVGGVGFKKTPRSCDECSKDLYDMVLDWEDALPEVEYSLAKRHTLLADLSLALGTSMRVHPAGKQTKIRCLSISAHILSKATIPLITVDKTFQKHNALSNIEIEEEDVVEDDNLRPMTEEEKKLASKNGRLAIINLQNTPHDRDCDVRVHGKCDEIMKELMKQLNVQIPDFVRVERYFVTFKDNVLSISSDEYVRNCLFVEKITVTSGEDVFESKAPHFAFKNVVKEGHSSTLKIVISFNKNADIKEWKIEKFEVSHNQEKEEHFDVEVVRKCYKWENEEESDNHDNEEIEVKTREREDLEEEEKKDVSNKKSKTDF